MVRYLAAWSVVTLAGAGAMATEAAYPRTSAGVFEIKTLPPSMTLTASSASSYFGSENRLFGRLFSYIRANRVSMTVPVEVEIDPGAMRFHVGVAERQLALSDSGEVSVSRCGPRLVAAYGMRGSYDESRWREGTERLRAWLAGRPDVTAAGEPYMVYWNSPFVPGFLKTSEVHIPLRPATGEPNEETGASMTYNPLTPEEEWVILHKGTERPFSGKFNNHFADGTYVCRRCSAPLYPSAAKFKSDCGWPSFDDDLAGAVRRQPDVDGRRTEIVCARCGGHLGHVFEGEGHTAKNTRHCVNSMSLDFVAADESRLETATFAGGCFWGTEYILQSVPGVVCTTVGYTGGSVADPTYKQVCSGQTGHAEAVEIRYDPRLVGYETLCRLFFETHDPTQLDRQGPDVGTQYRSVVFYHTDGQRQTAETLIGLLRAKGLDVVTAVVPAERFWPAEDYHQDYYNRTGRRPYCHVRVKRF